MSFRPCFFIIGWVTVRASSRAGLRSSSTTNFAIPQLRTKCGERVFSHAGPAAWNAVLEDMRAVSDSVLFRKRLKTHLFSLAFNVC